MLVTHFHLLDDLVGTYKLSKNTTASFKAVSQGNVDSHHLPAVGGQLLKFALFFCGAKRVRTDDLLVANQALSQLSYSPASPYSLFQLRVGLSGVEPLTSRLSGVRSNQLSYRPIFS